MAAKFDPDYTDISEEGLELRRIFCCNYRATMNNPAYGKYVIARYDGGTDADGREFKFNAWDKLVDFLHANSLDAEAYVEFAFTNYTIKTPYDLKRQEIINEYNSLMFSKNKPAVFDSELKVLDMNVTIRRSYSDLTTALRDAINDNAIGVSPLVRYSYACSKGVPFLAIEQTKDEALRQYKTKKYFYNHFFKDKIPEEFLVESTNGK